MNHLAYVIPTLDRIAGAEQQVVLLARGMRQRGWRVSVIALSGSGTGAASSLVECGVEFMSLNMRKGLADPRGWLRFLRWITRERPDVVHAHLPHAALLARWSRIAAPMRSLVETVHSPACGNLFRRMSYRASSGMPDLVTAVSQSAAQPWLNAHSIEQSRLAIIPNGIDLKLWSPNDTIRAKMRRKLALDNKFIWLAVGRLHPVKDHATMLRAFAKLPDSAFLLLAGEGPLENELRVLASTLGIDNRVRFLGYQPDVLNWMRTADAFVLCSRWEGLPLALMEASACELPSLIAEIPGAREVLPGPDMCIAPSASGPDALAFAMKGLMEMPEAQRCEMAQRARQSVAQRCDLDLVLEKWESTYTTLLEATPASRRSRGPVHVRGNSLQLQ